MQKNERSSADRIMVLCIAAFLFALLWFSGRIWQNAEEERKLCQSVVSLGEYVYDSEFLAEAKKIPGIRSISPVCETAVRLKAEDYTMDAVLLGVDLSELQKKVSRAAETEIGSTPVLLLGEQSLAQMTDANGHVASEKKQKEFLRNYDAIEWQYQLVESGSAGEAATEEPWRPCVVAGILSEPAEDIYLPYEQAAALAYEPRRDRHAETAGFPAGRDGRGITKILLTVRGETNYQKALGYYMEQKSSKKS